MTIPHKEAALALADEATAVAQRIGAANTITFEGERVLADNTDAFGFLENLKAGAPGWSASNSRNAGGVGCRYESSWAVRSATTHFSLQVLTNPRYFWRLS